MGMEFNPRRRVIELSKRRCLLSCRGWGREERARKATTEGDSCCVLIRIYFTAHRYIITYFDVSTFLSPPEPRRASKRRAVLTLFFSLCSLFFIDGWQRALDEKCLAVAKGQKKHALTHTECTIKYSFLLSPRRVSFSQKPRRAGCKCNLKSSARGAV